MKTVAFVPIKLNSQRLPGKNILPFDGQALCWYVFNTLLQVNEIDEIYVYCSDERITQYIPSQIKFLKRDPRLDGDLVQGMDIYQAFINEVDADTYVLAHATSPFQKPASIQSALLKMRKENYDSGFSAQKIQTFAWYKGYPINYSLDNIPRTQDIDPVYVETSGFFAFQKALWVQHKRRIGFRPYIQVVDHIEAIDIDTKEDFEFALLISKGMKGSEQRV